MLQNEVFRSVYAIGRVPPVENPDRYSVERKGECIGMSLVASRDHMKNFHIFKCFSPLIGASNGLLDVVTDGFCVLKLVFTVEGFSNSLTKRQV